MQMIIILRTSLRAVLFEGQHIDELCVYFQILFFFSFFYVSFVNDTDYMCIIIGRICSIWTGGAYRVIGQTIY